MVPCLDVKNGRVVKGLRFASIKDAGDPVALAARYAGEGADELVFLDITASEERRETIRSLVEGVAGVVDIPFTVGGGIATLQDARRVLLSGADKVAVNTAAVSNPGLITEMMGLFGRQCVVVAVDAKRNYDTDSGVNVVGDCWFEVFTYGGKSGTGIDAIWWMEEAQKRGRRRDPPHQHRQGRDRTWVRHAAHARGGPEALHSGDRVGRCGSAEHMADIFRDSDVDAALAASIFHYERDGVRGVKQLLRERGVPVRL